MSPADLAEVASLPLRYARALDDRREEDLFTVLTDDCVLDFGRFGSHQMPAAVEALRAAHLNYVATQHRVFNVQVDVGDGVASCHCLAESLYHGPERGALRRLHGRYVDEVVRTAEGWRIRHRTFELMFEERLAIVP